MQEGEEAQRGRVGPVGVVDAEHDGPARRRGSRTASRGRAGPRRTRRARRRAPRRPPARREPEHAGGQPRRPLQQVVALGGARLVEQRLEELAHDAEGEVALELGAARAQEARRPVLGGDAGRPRGRPTCRSRPVLRRPRCAPIPRAPRRSPRRCTRSSRSRSRSRSTPGSGAALTASSVPPARSGEGVEPSSRDRTAPPALKAGRGTGPGPLRGRW